MTPPSAGMLCRQCGAVTENAVIIYGRDRAGALVPREAQCRDGCTPQARARYSGPDRRERTRTHRASASP